MFGFALFCDNIFLMSELSYRMRGGCNSNVSASPYISMHKHGLGDYSVLSPPPKYILLLIVFFFFFFVMSVTNLLSFCRITYILGAIKTHAWGILLVAALGRVSQWQCLFFALGRTADWHANGSPSPMSLAVPFSWSWSIFFSFFFFLALYRPLITPNRSCQVSRYTSRTTQCPYYGSTWRIHRACTGITVPWSFLYLIYISLQKWL